MLISKCVVCGDEGSVKDANEWASREWRCPVCNTPKKPDLLTPEEYKKYILKQNTLKDGENSKN